MKFLQVSRAAAAVFAFSLCVSGSAAAQSPTLSATVNGTQVSVQWTGVPGAVVYDVVITGAVNGTVTLPATQTSYTVNAAPGEYTIAVRGRAGQVAGPFSNVVTVRVGGGPCPPLPQPTLTASVIGTVVTLTWEGVAGALGYRIEASRTAGGTEASQTVAQGITSVSFNVPAPGTYFARVVTGNGCSTVVSNEVRIEIGGAPGPQPPAPGPGPAGPRTPDPPPGTRLPLPAYGPAVTNAVAAQFPAALRNSCTEHGGSNEWLFRLVLALRQFDTRWGLNWKRGNVGDLSQDVVTYNFSAAPDEGTTNVYIIDVIFGHCGGNPGPTWIDQTAATRAAGTIGRWTLQPLRRVVPNAAER